MPASTLVTAEQLLQQLNWRYAVKKFDVTKKIPNATWRSLEEAVILSPSSFGLQPWKFIVVENPAVREALRQASYNQAQIVDASHLVVFTAKKTVTPEDVQHFINRTAAVRGVPVESLAQYNQYMLGFVAGSTPEALGVWAAHQVYIALGTFLTAAAILGVDACPMEGILGPQYDQILSVDPAYHTLCVATAGTRAADDPYAQAAKVRFPPAEVLQHVV